MGNLLDLIFENFWVVIILFGIISSLFGGNKKQQNGKPFSETTRMPTMAPPRQTEIKRKPQEKPYVKKVQEAASKIQNKEQVKGDLSTAQAYLAEKAAMAQKKTEQTPKKPLDRNQATAKEKVTQGTFSQNELVNGIIMAEILGAPRAKKPYSGSRR